MEIKEWLLWRPQWNKPYEKYQWSEKDKWWLKPDGSGDGFPLQKVEKYPNMFKLLDTEKEVDELLAEEKLLKRFGPRVKEYYDFACPKCGYHHCDNRDNYDVNLQDDYTQECACGHRIVVSTRFVYDVK